MRLQARVRAFLHHLFRATARRAWAVVAACFILYLLLDVWDALPQLQEFVVIVAGVAAGAIFLPELSASLWDLDPGRIRSLVPLAKVQGLHRAIVDASLEPDARSQQWADVVWSEAVAPLLRVGREPRAVVWDLSYDIGIHPARELSADSGVPVTFVTTRLRSRRVLPVTAEGTVWLSATRTSSALANEFQMEPCILRELVPLPGVAPDEWRDQVLQHCTARLTVDGVTVRLQVAPGPAIPDIVRWEAVVDPKEASGGHVPVEVSFDFPVDPDTTSFPVMFPRYFCAGSTRVVFTLHTGASDARLHAQPFLAQAPGRSFGDAEREITPVLQRYVLQSGSGSLLWPGSGVTFDWAPRRSL